MDWISPDGVRYRAPYGANKLRDAIALVILAVETERLCIVSVNIWQQ